MDEEKVKEFLDFYSREKLFAIDQFAFFQGICHIQLGNFIEAKKQFNRTVQSFFIPPFYWKVMGHPFWLIDFSIYAGRKDMFPVIFEELERYKTYPYVHDSLYAYYTYGLFEFLYPTGWDIKKSIQVLKKRPKVKETYAQGIALEALLNKDELGFQIAIKGLLKVHEGMAKRGNLRNSAEGLLCTSAMTMVYTAFQHQMPIEIENEYFSMDFLKFIMQES